LVPLIFCKTAVLDAAAGRVTRSGPTQRGRICPPPKPSKQLAVKDLFDPDKSLLELPVTEITAGMESGDFTPSIFKKFFKIKAYI
jgi:hypothetical protein